LLLVEVPFILFTRSSFYLTSVSNKHTPRLTQTQRYALTKPKKQQKQQPAYGNAQPSIFSAHIKNPTQHNRDKTTILSSTKAGNRNKRCAINSNTKGRSQSIFAQQNDDGNRVHNKVQKNTLFMTPLAHRVYVV